MSSPQEMLVVHLALPQERFPHNLVQAPPAQAGLQRNRDREFIRIFRDVNACYLPASQGVNNISRVFESSDARLSLGL
jgi:hypothetical protein